MAHRPGRCTLLLATLTVAALTLAAPSLRAQATATDSTHPVEPLWPGGAPLAHGSSPADRPTITVFLPATSHATGAAAVVFPGGGYEHLATGKEGNAVARWLNGLGVAAFVVRYRLGPAGYHYPVMLQDALRAVRVVRARAAAWQLDPHRIGVVGFSAGGHMASIAGTHFDAGAPASADPVERVSARPDFMVLVYPVITMAEPGTHHGSRVNLLGAHPPAALVHRMSSETQVTHDTPPTFLVATNDDAVVPVVPNTVAFYQALHAAGVPAELHIFAHGPHGFGLGPRDPALSAWPALCATWLRSNGWLTPPAHP